MSSSGLALKVIENEINFLNRLLEEKDKKIKELEHQLELEKSKNKTKITVHDMIYRPYVGYNTL